MGEEVASADMDLATLDAVASADLIRTGQASPTELVEAALERIDAVNPALNAVIHRRDERALAERDDVLRFDGAPFHDDVTLAGPVSFGATVVSTGRECDVFVRLCDVAPDGSAHLIARGQRTVHDATAPCRVEVPMGHTGYLLRAGHSLRVTVASSDAPEFVPAPGTGEHRWLAVDRVRTTQTIRLGGADPAVLLVHAERSSCEREVVGV